MAEMKKNRTRRRYPIHQHPNIRLLHFLGLELGMVLASVVVSSELGMVLASVVVSELGVVLVSVVVWEQVSELVLAPRSPF
jgi:uncharacterized membrane protein